MSYELLTKPKFDSDFAPSFRFDEKTIIVIIRKKIIKL